MKFLKLFFVFIFVFKNVNAQDANSKWIFETGYNNTQFLKLGVNRYNFKSIGIEPFNGISRFATSMHFKQNYSFDFSITSLRFVTIASGGFLINYYQAFNLSGRYGFNGKFFTNQIFHPYVQAGVSPIVYGSEVGFAMNLGLGSYVWIYKNFGINLQFNYRLGTGYPTHYSFGLAYRLMSGGNDKKEEEEKDKKKEEHKILAKKDSLKLAMKKDSLNSQKNTENLKDIKTTESNLKIKNSFKGISTEKYADFVNELINIKNEAFEFVPNSKKSKDFLKIRIKDVAFEVGKSKLNPNFHSVLDSIVTLLKKGNFNVKIEGHTDSKGSDITNRRISVNRAKSVKKYIVTKGGGKYFERQHLFKLYGYGSRIPIATNLTVEGRSKNRRVEIRINPLKPKDILREMQQESQIEEQDI